MKLRNQKQGFTIIETLVAITVLMIAIAGPLSIASKGLTAALASRDQMIASYLAQESIEVIKNIRDNNISLGVAWNTGFTSCDNITSTHHCDASLVDVTTILATSRATYPLKLTSTNYYSHGSTGASTPFSRYFYLTQPNSSGACLSTDVECLVTVVVDWSEGTLPYSVTVSSQILNSPR